MLRVGDVAPDFETTDQNGDIVRLSERLAEGSVILCFYPADFSPVCTAQACAFRDRTGSLADIDIQIFGISPQSSDSHRRFAEAYDLPFPLLSDTKKRIIRAYGVDGPLGFGVRRATFLIDADGTIGNRVVSDLFVGSHTSFVQSVLAETRP
jgi:peroxiredoxin Q/BCP